MANESIFQLNIIGPEEFSQQFQIPTGITSIGRQSGNTLQLNHTRVSRKHAILQCTSNQCQLADLGSSNGTFVDGEKLVPKVPTQLHQGTTIKIGPFVLSFEQIPVETRQEEISSPMERIAEEPVAIKPPPEIAAPPPPETPSKMPVFSDDSLLPPDLFTQSGRLWRYLPGIYHTEFMRSFLAVFESILAPIEWNVDNFDLFLNPKTAPTDFLPWLANWFEITFDSTWSEEQRRTLLSEVQEIYARRGTKWALSRVLEIYTGQEPEIDDTNEALEAFTFTVELPVGKRDVNQELIEAIINTNKPAHTVYTLKFAK
jgi:phage tail-like protein